LECRSLERARRDDDVTFFLEDPVHPVDGRLGVARRLPGCLPAEKFPTCASGRQLGDQ
jgi:hypothetical protein